jgi:hypothetical protein
LQLVLKNVPKLSNIQKRELLELSLIAPKGAILNTRFVALPAYCLSRQF